jgi:cytidylate kinase
VNVVWIGGPPGAGKTTLARTLALRHGLRLYSADTMTWVHRDRALAAGNSAAGRWAELGPDRRWDQPLEELVAMSLHRERGEMVLEDLRTLPDDPLVVAEGSTLPAWAVDTSRAAWLSPPRDVLRERLERRGTRPGQLRLYLALADVIEREAHEHRVPIVKDATEAEGLLAVAVAAGPTPARKASETR